MRCVLAETRMPARSRKPGDVVIRRQRLRPQHIAARPRRIVRRGPTPPIILIAGFIALIAIGTAFLSLPIASVDGGWTNLETSLFTATSASLVTGLVVVDTSTYWSGFGQAVILMLIQLGGLGFMTGATLLFLIAGRRLGLRERILLRDSVGSFELRGVASIAVRIAILTLIVEAVGAIVLLANFAAQSDQPLQSAWPAVFLAVSAFNNAGFDLSGGFRSLTILRGDNISLLVIAVLCAIGGTGYFVLSELYRKRSLVRLSIDSKIVLSAMLTFSVLGAAVILIAEHSNPATLGELSWPEKLVHSFFQSISSRTSGFTTIDISKMTDHSLFYTIGPMFIGGASGSTAGGIKLNTFTVLLFAILSALAGKGYASAFKRTLGAGLINRSLTIALLSVVLVFAFAFTLAITEDVPFLWVLFETVSAYATNGLSTGITRDLSLTGRVVIVAAMFVGRLGPLTLAIYMAGRPVSSSVNYPEEPVRIG